MTQTTKKQSKTTQKKVTLYLDLDVFENVSTIIKENNTSLQTLMRQVFNQINETGQLPNTEITLSDTVDTTASDVSAILNHILDIKAALINKNHQNDTDNTHSVKHPLDELTQPEMPFDFAVTNFFNESQIPDLTGKNGIQTSPLNIDETSDFTGKDGIQTKLSDIDELPDAPDNVIDNVFTVASTIEDNTNNTETQQFENPEDIDYSNPFYRTIAYITGEDPLDNPTNEIDTPIVDERSEPTIDESSKTEPIDYKRKAFEALIQKDTPHISI